MPRVNIEAQLLCVEPHLLRGIPFYITNLVKSLYRRARFNVSVSIFDFKGERGNRVLVERNLGKDINDLKILETNQISYRDIMRAIELQDEKLYQNLNYEEYFSEKAEVYHIPTIENVPQNITSGLVVTAHDIMPLLDMYRGKSVWTPKSTMQMENSVLYIKREKRAQVIADSNATKADLINYYDIEPNRISVIPLSYDMDKVFHDVNEDILTKYSINRPYVLYVGVIDNRKGILEILKAFEVVKDKGFDVQLVLAGRMLKGYEQQYNAIYSENRYKTDIIMTGYIIEEEKRALLSSAEIFLFPSEYEGFGIPVLEAMACGAPVIATNSSSLPEVGGDAVEYIDVGSVEQLADKMMKLLINGEARKNLIEKGYYRIKDFSWEKTAMMTESVYQKAYEISR